MNERIRELWIKAAREDSDPDNWDTQEQFIERFAQLIVEECARLCKHESNDDEHDQFDMGQSVKAESIKTAIKQHFGIQK